MEEKKHPGGRPQLYNPDIHSAKVREYVASCVDKEERIVVSEGEKTTGYKIKVRVNIPTIEGLALYLGIRTQTIYDWESKFEEFSEVISELRQEQANRLIKSGLSGDYNSIIAKVLLSKHGYKEIKEEQHTGKDGKELFPAPDDQQKERLKKLL